MTITEFNSQIFGAGDKAKYDGGIFKIASVCFKECLIGLKMNISVGDPDDVSWVRYENVEYLG